MKWQVEESCRPKPGSSSLSGSCLQMTGRWRDGQEDWSSICAAAGAVLGRRGEEPDHWFTGLFIHVPTLIYDHDFWVRTRSQVQATKMRLGLSSVGRFKLIDVVQSGWHVHLGGVGPELAGEITASHRATWVPPGGAGKWGPKRPAKPAASDAWKHAGVDDLMGSLIWREAVRMDKRGFFCFSKL